MRVVLEARNTLGEGIVWCDRAQALYWTDIHAATLWRHAPASGDMSAIYRQGIEDQRLRAVADHVHGWLFAKVAKQRLPKKAKQGK